MLSTHHERTNSGRTEDKTRQTGASRRLHGVVRGCTIDTDECPFSAYLGWSGVIFTVGVACVYGGLRRRQLNELGSGDKDIPGVPFSSRYATSYVETCNYGV